MFVQSITDLSITEKKSAKRTGAMIQPCLVPFVTSKKSELPVRYDRSFHSLVEGNDDIQHLVRNAELL